MEKNIEKFISYISQERNLSPLTVAIYKNDLLGLNSFSDGTPDKQKIREYLNSFKGNSPETRARKLSCFRSFFKFCVKEGIMASNPAEGVEMPKISHKEPQFLSESEFKRLEACVDKWKSPNIVRNKAIVRLFLGSGIRVSELAGLKKQDVNLEGGWIKVKRKGGKEQTIPISEKTVSSLKEYLWVRGGSETPNFFLSRTGKPLTPSSVYNMVRKSLERCGIVKGKMGCHLLRHTFCTQLMNKDVNLVVIQELAGHRNLETTRKYLHINSKDLREAVERV